MPASSVTFGAQQASRPILLQYQSVVGPFVTVQSQAAPERPGASAGGAIAYRPTLTQYQSLAGPPGVFPSSTVQVGWTTVLGVQVRRAAPQPGTQWVGPLRVADTTAAVPVVSWQGWYPDRLWRRESPRVGAAAISLAAAIPFQDPSRFAWRTVAPDWISRRAFPAAAQRFLALETPVQYPIPDTSWLPVAPAWLRPPRPSVERSVWVQNIDPLPNAPSPTLAWQGWFPPRLDRPQRLVEFSAYTQPPKLTPFTPDLVGGLAVYPDRIDRRVFPPTAQRVWTDRFEIVVPDLRRDWASSYPDQVWQAARLHPAVAQGAPWVSSGNPSQVPTDWRRVGEEIVRRLTPAFPGVGSTFSLVPDLFVGELLSWEPRLFYLPRRRVIPVEWAIIGNLNPSVPGGGIGCVEILYFATAEPDVRWLRSTQSDLINLAYTTAEGTDLDLC